MGFNLRRCLGMLISCLTAQVLGEVSKILNLDRLSFWVLKGFEEVMST
jgi:hypothetical protein